MTERTVSTGGGQCDSEADGPADCEVIFSILLIKRLPTTHTAPAEEMIDANCSGTNQLCVDMKANCLFVEL